jgi:hypothetical protein
MKKTYILLLLSLCFCFCAAVYYNTHDTIKLVQLPDPPPTVDYNSLIAITTTYYDDLQQDNKTFTWKFIDITQYPYYCAETLYSTKTVNIIIDTITVDQFVDSKHIVHVRIAVLCTSIYKKQQQTFWMNYYYYDKQWILERPPVKTNIIQKKNYYLCK